MTIKDIARESGYSVGTVSRVLNHVPGVSEASRTAVMAVVEKYNFQLNSNAKLLKQQNNSGIAIIIKGTQNMLFATIVESLQGLVEKRGYSCSMNYIDEENDEVDEALRIIRERRPLGIMFLGSNQEFYDDRFKQINVPCIMVTNSAKELGLENLSSVGTDDTDAARTAILHLIELGHENIGILGGNTEHSYPARMRFEGCRKAFTEKHMLFDMNRQYEASYFTIAAGYQAMERLLDRMPEVTAVFAMSDVMAIGAMRLIRDRGLRVPEDISVIGFDGIDIGRYTMPRLTTIRQHREMIASRSVEILLDCIENEGEAVHEMEQFHLVPGESVARR